MDDWLWVTKPPVSNRVLTKINNSSQCCGLPIEHSQQVTLFGRRLHSHAQTLTSLMGTAGTRRTAAFGKPSRQPSTRFSTPRPSSPKSKNARDRPGLLGRKHQKHDRTPETSTPCAGSLWSAPSTPRSRRLSSRTAPSLGSSRSETSYRSIHCSTTFGFTSFFVSWFRLLASFRLYLFQELSFEY